MALRRQSVENGVVSRIEDAIGGWVAGVSLRPLFQRGLFVPCWGSPPARYAQNVMEDAFA